MSLEKLRKWNDQWPHWKFTKHQQAALTELFAEVDALKHDIERYVEIATVETNRAEAAEAERDRLAADNARLREALSGACDQILDSYRTWVADDTEAHPRPGQERNNHGRERA